MKAYGNPIGLEELKQIQLEVLLDVAAFCECSGLRYSLCAGTLLGAVRHQGFIPWDDDIDIMMPRPDYDRFLQTYRSDGPYAVQCTEVNPDYPLPFAAVCDTRTLRIEHELREKCTRSLGVGIDIFPIDQVPGDLSAAEEFYRQIGAQWRRRTCIVDRFGRGKTWFSTIYRNIAIACFRLMEALGITSVEKEVRASIALATRYDAAPSGRAGVTSIYHYGVRESHPSDVYDGWTDYPFEGHHFKGITHSDAYLSGMYGPDYMELPPEEKRITHHTSNCFWKK